MKIKNLIIIILIIGMILGTSLFCYKSNAAEIDGQKLKEGMTLETTKNKNIYRSVITSEGVGQYRWFLKDSKGLQIPSGSQVTYEGDPEDDGETTYRKPNPKIDDRDFGGEHDYIFVRYKNLAGNLEIVAIILDTGGLKIVDVDVSDEDKEKAKEFVEKYKDKKARDFQYMDTNKVKEIYAEGQEIYDKTKNKDVAQILGTIKVVLNDEGELTTGDTIYKNPIRTSSTETSEQGLDDMLGDAETFVNQGEIKYNEDALKNFSKTMYNILLAVGIAIAVIVGGIIGIKLMTTGIEGKAEAKKLLVPYVVGCVVVFGAFGIWKLIVYIVSGI